MDPWRNIEELARPTVPPGSGEVLAAALERRVRDGDALAAIQRWAGAGGGLPMLESLDIGGAHASSPALLALLALDAANDAEGIAAVGYLAYRLMAEGRGLMDRIPGVGITEKTVRRANQLGLSFTPRRAPSFVRIAASEAWFAYHTRTYLADPDRIPTSASVVLMAARPEELHDVLAFWGAALANAIADEPAVATVDRMRHAAKGDDDVRMVAIFEQYAAKYDAVCSTPSPDAT